MKIDPSNARRPDRSAVPIGDAAETPAPRAGKTAEPEPVAFPADRVELSDAARELQALGSSGATLEPARLRQILNRMTDGHYDRPEVRREVLLRLASDLGIDTDS